MRTVGKPDQISPAGAPGLHVAIIMDGNGRWATCRGLPRAVGHRAGAKAVRRTVESAPDIGITALTLYAFSSDNWQRPPAEVSALMMLLSRYLQREAPKLAANGVRLRVVGRRDRLAPSLLADIERAEARTADGDRLVLRVAVDYSGRDSIRRALSSPAQMELLPDVDLLIRTGREKRLSDFLLWECAYAELWFTDVLWPDFGVADLRAAVDDFRGRDRRFGGVEPAPRAAVAGDAPRPKSSYE
jgi:undecaprenyl diphosphate synthase